MTGRNDAVKADNVRPLPTVATDLGSMAKRLTEAVEQLESRLAPLVPEVPRPSKAETKDTPQTFSPVVAHLRSVWRNLDDLLDRIARLVESVDV